MPPVDMMDFNIECIECLLMDNRNLSEERRKAAAQFAKLHKEELLHEAEDIVKTHIKTPRRLRWRKDNIRATGK